MDEVEEIGSLIGKVTATDADDSSTSDGVFSYTLVGSFPFTLDSSSGLIIIFQQLVITILISILFYAIAILQDQNECLRYLMVKILF